MSKEEKRLHQETLLIINSICGAQFMLETLENVRGTWYFRQQLKSVTKNFIRVAERHNDKAIEHLFQKDEELIQDVLESISGILQRVSRLRPDEIILMDEVLKGLESGTLEVVQKEENS